MMSEDTELSKALVVGGIANHDPIEYRFQDINQKFLFWEMELKRNMWDIEHQSRALGFRISNTIISHPSYDWGSLHNFLTDFVGADYCKNYTAADWKRHYEIESLKKR